MYQWDAPSYDQLMQSRLGRATYPWAVGEDVDGMDDFFNTLLWFFNFKHI